MTPEEFQSGLCERLRSACGERSIHSVAVLTRTHPETTRRYLRGLNTPSVEFLAGLCEALEVSGDWLLTGRGLPAVLSSVDSALARATPRQLLIAFANSIQNPPLAENAAQPELGFDDPAQMGLASAEGERVI